MEVEGSELVHPEPQDSVSIKLLVLNSINFLAQTIYQSRYVFQGLEKEFDTTDLVRSCVQSAVSMLRDIEDGGSLSTRRVDILLTLLDSGDELRGSSVDHMHIHLTRCDYRRWQGASFE